jgi:hypothetical protein
MATGSGAFNTKGGYNQSGGGYYIVISDIVPAKLNVFTPGTGSGGATTSGSFAAAGAADLPGGVSTLFLAGKIIKDMGKTLVSANRTFRKVQAVVAGTIGAASLGVAGAAASATAPGYVTFYLETGREGQNAATALPAIARYL